MGYRFIDENTLNNIANAIRTKSKTNDLILGSEIANAISNISTGSPFMEGAAIAFDTNNVYMGDGITDISTFKYNNLFNLGSMFPDLHPSTLIIGNNVINAFNAFGSYPTGSVNTVICGPNVVNYNSAFMYRSGLNNVNIGNNVVDMGFCYSRCGGLCSGWSSPVSIRIPDSVISMPNAFEYCSSLNADVIIGNNVSYAAGAFQGDDFLNSLTFACENGTDNLGNLYYAFARCPRLTGTAYLGNAYEVNYAYQGCSNITNVGYIGDRLIEFGYVFQGCYNLSGPAFCGNNVRQMNNAYSNTKISIAACGPQVESMVGAYVNCINLVEANIGDNVRNASSAFASCPFLTTPVMGNNIIYMNSLYYNCFNLTGAPLCSNSVIDMTGAYSGCNLLSGEPAISPMTTVTMSGAYYGCPDIYGNMYLIYRGSSSNYSVENMFTGRDATKRLNIFIQNFPISIVNSETGVQEITYDSPWDSILRTQNIIGTPLEWTNIDNGFYNELANIYVYTNYNYKEYKDGKDASWAWTRGTPGVNNDTFANVYDVEATNIYGAFSQSSYLGEFVCSDNVVNMGQCYSQCRSVSPFVCGENVIDMSGAYTGCINGYGDYVCGPNVENMSGTYINTNAQGSLACGSKVINFSSCYAGCVNIIGEPVCGDNVVDMTGTYSGCSNISGTPVIGANVKWMGGAYYGCQKLTGDVVIPRNVVYAASAFASCTNLNGNAFVPNTCVHHIATFSGCNSLKRIVFEDGIPEIRAQACAGCTNANVYIPNSVCFVHQSSLSGVKRICYYGSLNYSQWGANLYGKHDYDLNNLPNKIEPTCEESGSTGIFPCKYCGITSSKEDIKVLPPLGHDIDETTGYCNRCGQHFHKEETDIIMEWIEVNSGTYKFIEIDTNKYKSNNKGISSSTADTTWKIEIKGNENQIISIPWEVESEASNYDYLNIFIDGIKVLGPKGGTLQKDTLTQELSPGQHTLQATYRKDNSGNTGADAATITLIPISAHIVDWVKDI